MTQRGLIDTEPATNDKRGTELTVTIAEHVYTNIVESGSGHRGTA